MKRGRVVEGRGERERERETTPIKTPTTPNTTQTQITNTNTTSKTDRGDGRAQRRPGQRPLGLPARRRRAQRQVRRVADQRRLQPRHGRVHERLGRRRVHARHAARGLGHQADCARQRGGPLPLPRDQGAAARLLQHVGRRLCGHRHPVGVQLDAGRRLCRHAVHRGDARALRRRPRVACVHARLRGLVAVVRAAGPRGTQLAAARPRARPAPGAAEHRGAPRGGQGQDRGLLSVEECAPRLITSSPLYDAQAYEGPIIT